MKNFQLIVLAVFIAFAIGGIIVFATFKGSGSKDAVKLSMWGLAPQKDVVTLLGKLGLTSAKDISVTYLQKAPGSFDAELAEALAEGKGPDMVLLPHELILRHQTKLLPITFETLSERTFRDTFIEEGELYLLSSSLIGLPFSVDPLVMYWNRDLFSNAGLATVPSYWDELFELAPVMTVRDDAGNISKTTVALGEYGNVTHAKEVLSTLMLQAGNPVVARNVKDEPVIVFGENRTASGSVAESTVRFYTEFSNSAKPVYTWNRSLAPSKELFIAGDLAVYFGFASEISDIRRKNPNLNFDVASMPQVRDSKTKITYGRMTGVSVLKNSPYPAQSFAAATTLIGASAGAEWSTLTGLPPVRRDLLSKKPGDAYMSVFYAAALASRGWLDPAPIESGEIFGTMIENVTSGRLRITESVKRASEELTRLLK